MRTYVTGGTGFVGSNIVKVFAERHGAEVHCPVHRFVPADASCFTTERLDLLDGSAVRASVAAFGPDVIVHSMILNDFAAMYADRELAWRSYVGTTETLARAAEEAGGRMELARIACNVFDLDPALLSSTPPDTSAAGAVGEFPIPYDTSLSLRRTREVLGYEPPGIRELLIRFRRERATGRFATAKEASR